MTKFVGKWQHKAMFASKIGIVAIIAIMVMVLLRHEQALAKEPEVYRGKCYRLEITDSKQQDYFLFTNTCSDKNTRVGYYCWPRSKSADKDGVLTRLLVSPEAKKTWACSGRFEIGVCSSLKDGTAIYPIFEEYQAVGCSEDVPEEQIAESEQSDSEQDSDERGAVANESRQIPSPPLAEDTGSSEEKAVSEASDSAAANVSSDDLITGDCHILQVKDFGAFKRYTYQNTCDDKKLSTAYHCWGENAAKGVTARMLLEPGGVDGWDCNGYMEVGICISGLKAAVLHPVFDGSKVAECSLQKPKRDNIDDVYQGI